MHERFRNNDRKYYRRQSLWDEWRRISHCPTNWWAFLYIIHSQFRNCWLSTMRNFWKRLFQLSAMLVVRTILILTRWLTRPWRSSAGRWGHSHRRISTAMVTHQLRSSAMLSNDDKDWPVHFFMSSMIYLGVLFHELRLRRRLTRNLASRVRFRGHPTVNQAVIGSCLPFGAAKIEQRRREDNCRRHNAGLLKSGGRKNLPPLPLQPFQVMGLPLPFLLFMRTIVDAILTICGPRGRMTLFKDYGDKPRTAIICLFLMFYTCHAYHNSKLFFTINYSKGPLYTARRWRAVYLDL